MEISLRCWYKTKSIFSPKPKCLRMFLYICEIILHADSQCFRLEAEALAEKVGLKLYRVCVKDNMMVSDGKFEKKHSFTY